MNTESCILGAICPSLRYNGLNGKDETKMRILLAEDERPLARAIVKIFEKNHYSADAVHNGEDALLYLESGNYDVVVMDVMMPKMDGITALKKAENRRQYDSCAAVDCQGGGR